MYKSVAFVTAIALSLAVLVGMNPPDTAALAPEAVETSGVADEPAAEAEKKPVSNKTRAGNGFASTTLYREADGHFYADATVNGARVRFMVDTGATSVVLSKADAQSAGLQFNSTEFTGSAETAGGPIKLKPVTLDRVAVGPVEATSVEGVIGDDTVRQSLLGQSWLSRVGTVNIENDRMELR